MIKIYNTQKKKKEPFKLRTPNKVAMYVCGPTVYDYIHLGNARSFTAFDMIVRFLRFSGHEVNYVRNITDIDDKIIMRANETGSEFSVVAKQFTNAFKEDMHNLGLIPPTHEPLATAFLPHIIALIEKLIATGKAYVAENGDVYYEVRSFEHYGCLAHRNLDELESGARVEISNVKRDPLDFVLWKMAKSGEPAWDSPWGFGRPGWHIECSAMSMHLLGESFDMHGGGRDLIFPHHENEIAQSEGVTGKSFVRYWLHAGYLQMEKEKMSKSLGNFFTLRDLLGKYPAEVLRFFLLSSHYRSSLAYSEDAIVRSHQSLSRLYAACLDLPVLDVDTSHPYFDKFMAAMNDDFNTPIAFSVLFDVAHEIQRLRQIDQTMAAKLATLLRHLGGVFGFLQMDPATFLQGDIANVDSDRIEKLISDRNVARAAKNWAEADRIRDVLLSESIVLEDGPNGTQWKRATS